MLPADKGQSTERFQGHGTGAFVASIFQVELLVPAPSWSLLSPGPGKRWVGCPWQEGFLGLPQTQALIVALSHSVRFSKM